MRLLFVTAAVLGLTSVACCGAWDDGAVVMRFDAGLQELRDEAGRHHDRAQGAGSVAELHDELDRHDIMMGEAMDRMRHAMADLDCTDGMAGMTELMSGMDGMLAAHRQEVEAAAALEEAKAACTRHRDETLDRADRMEAHAGEMSCDLGHMGRMGHMGR